MTETPSMSAKEARVSLEQLRDITHVCDPYQPAPLRWIAELHEILEAVAPREAHAVYLMDRLTGVNMGYLHQRVLDVLRDLDRLVTERE